MALVVQNEGAGRASYVAENNVLFQVKGEVVEVDRLRIHLYTKRTAQQMTLWAGDSNVWMEQFV